MLLLNSNYLCKPHGHVITGNMCIVEDTPLRNLPVKGTKYRIADSYSFKDVQDNIEESVSTLLQRICKKNEHKIGAYKCLSTASGN